MKFQAARVTHEYTQTNCAPPETVFPLLCPVREADWVPGWQYRLIYSQSGFAEAGCVFITEEDGREITWIVTEHNPKAFRIAFVWLDPPMVTAQITIQLKRVVAAPTALPMFPVGGSAAERRQNKAHGASRGYKTPEPQALEGRKISCNTTAHIRYTYTALSPEGNREIQRFTETCFHYKMQSWETAINHYLKTGKRIEAATLE